MTLRGMNMGNVNVKNIVKKSLTNGDQAVVVELSAGGQKSVIGLLTEADTGERPTIMICQYDPIAQRRFFPPPIAMSAMRALGLRLYVFGSKWRLEPIRYQAFKQLKKTTMIIFSRESLR